MMKERIRREIQTIRNGVVVFSETDKGQRDHLAYQMKMALNRIEFEVCGENPIRKIYDLRSEEIKTLEFSKDQVFKSYTSSLVKFYCSDRDGNIGYFNCEAIVPFNEDDETFFAKCEIPAKRLMQHLGETDVTVEVWIGDHSQIVWSSKW